MSNAGSDEFEGGRLFELYTRYVTEPESKRDVYGYTVLVVGYLLSMGGMVVYLVGPTGGDLTPVTAQFREISFSMAGVGLVVTLFGVVLMLPVRRRGTLAGAVGTAMGLGAAVWFVAIYPQDWGVGVPDYSPQIITLYTAGIAIVAGVVVLVPVVTGERSYFAAAREALGQEHPDVMVGEADRGGLFALFKQGSDWTWRLIDQSAIATSTDGFLSRLETEDRVDRVKAAVEDAALLEITHAAFRIYQAGEDRWRWLLMGENGTTVADSGDEFPSRQSTEASVNDLKEFGPEAEVITIDDAAFETYSDGGGVRWRLVDDRRTPLAEGPNRYADGGAARGNADAFADRAVDAPVITVETYGVELRAAGDAWEWRIMDTELDVLATGSDVYSSKGRAEEAAYEVIDRLGAAAVVSGVDASYDVYESPRGWQWRLVTPEDRTVAVGTDVGADRSVVVEDVRTFKGGAADAGTVEIRDQDFELYRSDGAWHWRLVDGDRNVRAHSVDEYDSQDEAVEAIQHLWEHAPDADLIEFERAAFQIYESDDGQWRWRLIDEDGNVLADSSQGEYESKDGATAAMSTLQEYAPDAEQLEIETAAFELFEEGGEWGWRLVDDIGETIARGTRRYPSRADAQEDMDALRGEVRGVEARVMDTAVFQVYHDEDDTWWWRFIQPGGSIIAESPAGFATRHAAEDAIEALQAEHAGAGVATVGTLAVLVDRAGQRWTWSLVDYERATVAEATESYDSREQARAVAEDVKSAAASITVFEVSDATFLVTGGDGWTWSLLASDHEPLAVGPGTYETAANAEDAVYVVAEHAGEAEHIEFETAAFEVVETEDGWRWRLVDEAREVIAASAETYASRRSVEDAMAAVREALPDASILEIERAAFELHEGDDGWRWRLVDERGNQLAESLAAHSSRTEARDAMNTVQTYAPDAWTSVAD